MRGDDAGGDVAVEVEACVDAHRRADGQHRFRVDLRRAAALAAAGVGILAAAAIVETYLGI